MGNPNPSNSIKPGTTRNKNGAPPGPRVIKSKLTSLSKALREMEEMALENIKKSVEGKEVNSESLASSKWVCSSLVTIDKAVLQEEMARTKLKLELLEVRDELREQSPEEIAKETKSRLSLVYNGDDD